MYCYKRKTPLHIVSIILTSLFFLGCATQIKETAAVAQKASIPLGSFDHIYLVRSELAPEYNSHGANQKAANKINEVLANRLRFIFNDVTVVDNLDQVSTKAESTTLVIKPLIKQIKFIGGAARFWAGAMAGSSVIVIDVDFIDADNNKSVGKVGFVRKGNAYAGAWSMGASDNNMLTQVVDDILNYVSINR